MAALDVLGVERIDHGLPVLDDPELVRRMAGERIPITVCPTSNVLIANTFERLEDHTYPDMRAAGLLATVNTDDPAFIDLDLGAEYAAVAEAFGWGWAGDGARSRSTASRPAGSTSRARRTCARGSPRPSRHRRILPDVRAPDFGLTGARTSGTIPAGRATRRR